MMGSYTEAKAAREWAANNTPLARARRDQCPVCPGNLDTGYECCECGFDALPIIIPQHDRASILKE